MLLFLCSVYWFSVGKGGRGGVPRPLWWHEIDFYPRGAPSWLPAAACAHETGSAVLPDNHACCALTAERRLRSTAAHGDGPLGVGSRHEALRGLCFFTPNDCCAARWPCSPSILGLCFLPPGKVDVTSARRRSRRCCIYQRVGRAHYDFARRHDCLCRPACSPRRP